MYIKEKNIKDNKLTFKTSPIFKNELLVHIARKLVDDYFTFTNWKEYSQSYNFRKYSIEPIRNDDKKMIGLTISELLFSGRPFIINCFKSGTIEITIPDDLEELDKQTFESRFERMISYVV